MSVIAWLTVAWAGSLYAAADLPFGEPLDSDQVYAVDVPEPWNAGHLPGDPADLQGRIPRFRLPKNTALRPEHFFPEGTEPGPEGLVPEGHGVLRVRLPAPASFFVVGDRVDVYLERGDGWCLAASNTLVLGLEDLQPLGEREVAQTVLVGLPDAARDQRKDATNVAISLRNPIDTGPSRNPLCEESP